MQAGGHLLHASLTTKDQRFTEDFTVIEFGILKGVISKVSSVPEKMRDGSIAYNIEVSFPGGLVSTYRKTIPFIQNMDGEAEIITRDQRLIEHFIEPIVSLFRNK